MSEHKYLIYPKVYVLIGIEILIDVDMVTKIVRDSLVIVVEILRFQWYSDEVDRYLLDKK